MSWYRTGTVTVTNGSKNVTGVGTLWTTAVNVGDAFALVDANLNPTGAWYEVESVTNNTTLVLKQSYAGATGSNKQYCVFNLVGNMTTPSFAQRLATFFASFQSLIDKPTTTPTASSIPVADSNGDIADGWIPATVARLASPALTGSPTAPTQTASDASTKIATTAHVKSALSAIGVGTTTNTATSTDWNDLPTEFPTSGIVGFLVSPVATPINKPSNAWFYVMHLIAGTSVTQVAFPYRVGFANIECIWMRNRYNGVWSTWRMVYDQYNILGTVSQSNGVPTGAVIERGSNANGSYVKFADGTMICSINNTVTDQAIDTSYGSVYTGTRGWTFPAAFSVTPVTTAGTGRWGTGASWCSARNSSSASATLIFYDVNSRSTGTDFVYFASAIGRWF